MTSRQQRRPEERQARKAALRSRKPDLQNLSNVSARRGLLE